MSFIIFLYLLENETSYLILIPQFIAIGISVWKLINASEIKKTDTFPYFALKDKQSYLDSETKQYDEEAMKYLGYAMWPLVACYTVYSIVYNEHKGYYSFVLNTLVGCIYVFGFIEMTPQLYINYKMKSVEHMPSNVMVYRFLNTIIDDLFSFIIKMPTMHRISCFRDDVIFVIYIYQRWIYRVDKTRGLYATEDKNKNKAIAPEVAEAKKIEQAKLEEQGRLNAIKKKGSKKVTYESKAVGP